MGAMGVGAAAEGGRNTARERMIIDTFVEFAGTLAGDFEVGEFLQLLVDRCAELLAADTAGVLLEAPDGSLRIAAATSEEMLAIKNAEMETGHGPCMEAYRTGARVLVESIDDYEDRWSDIMKRLRDMGMRSGYGFPLSFGGDCIGGLNLFHRKRAPFDDKDVELGQAFADVAAVGIMQQRKITAAEQRAEQLQGALDSRVLIEQAKGMLARQHGISPEVAFVSLRRYARNNGRKLRELCQEVVSGELDDVPVGD